VCSILTALAAACGRARGTPVPEAPVRELVEPADAACTLVGEVRAGALRFAPDGPVFAWVRQERATVKFAIAEPPFALMTVDVDSVSARGLVAPTDVPLYPRPGLTLSGIALPKARTELAWSGRKRGALRVSVSTARVLASNERIEDDVPCAALGLDSIPFDARATVTQAPVGPKSETVNAETWIATAPHAAPAARLLPGLVLEVLEVGPEATRVLAVSPDALIVGWLDPSNLRASSQLTFTSLSEVKLNRLRGGGDFISPLWRCGRDLPLIVEVGGARARVGTIRRGVGFDRLDRAATNSERDERAYIRIRVPAATGWLELADEARWVLPAMSIADCVKAY
jgi:hypothetical protein